MSKRFSWLIPLVILHFVDKSNFVDLRKTAGYVTYSRKKRILSCTYKQLYGWYIKPMITERNKLCKVLCNIMSRNILHNLFSSLLLSANYFITFFERCNFTFEYTL